MISDHDWEDFKAKFNKRYTDDKEEQMRRKLYSKAKQRIDEQNKLYEANAVTYRMEVCKYSDYTPEELSRLDGNVCTIFKRPRNDRMPELPQFEEEYGTYILSNYN